MNKNNITKVLLVVCLAAALFAGYALVRGVGLKKEAAELRNAIETAQIELQQQEEEKNRLKQEIEECLSVSRDDDGSHVRWNV